MIKNNPIIIDERNVKANMFKTSIFRSCIYILCTMKIKR